MYQESWRLLNFHCGFLGIIILNASKGKLNAFITFEYGYIINCSYEIVYLLYLAYQDKMVCEATKNLYC